MDGTLVIVFIILGLVSIVSVARAIRRLRSLGHNDDTGFSSTDYSSDTGSFGDSLDLGPSHDGAVPNDSSHHAGCEVGSSHDSGVDCGDHGGFDGGGGHH